MPELPASWGLKTRKSQNRLEVVQKGTDGQEHRARLCEGPELTDHDVEQIALHDHEKVTSRDIATRAKLERERYWENFNRTLDDEYAEPAEQVAFAGCHVYSTRVGYSRKYSMNYERIFQEEN